MICFIQIAAVFVMLGAEFLAVIQIIVYTGAILVLLLFVLMLVDPEDLLSSTPGGRCRRRLALCSVRFFSLEVAAAVVTRTIVGRRGNATLENIEAVGGNTEALGRQIYTEHLLAFEVVSMVLTIGILGAIVLAMPERLGISTGRRRDTISLGHPRGTDLALLAPAPCAFDGRFEKPSRLASGGPS
ncbi:MAG: NADH-quinone oxidoreductase subunit J [Thermomicrobiales bacterium]